MNVKQMNKIGTMLTQLDVEARTTMGSNEINWLEQRIANRRVQVRVSRSRDEDVRTIWYIDGERIGYAKLVEKLARLTGIGYEGVSPAGYRAFRNAQVQA